MSLISDITFSFKKKCPACKKGQLFSHGLDVVEKCDMCGFDLSHHDAGDGAVVFFTFILGTLFVPLALILEYMLSPPIWAQALLWSIMGIGFIITLMPPVKAYIIALNYKHTKDN